MSNTFLENALGPHRVMWHCVVIECTRYNFYLHITVLCITHELTLRKDILPSCIRYRYLTIHFPSLKKVSFNQFPLESSAWFWLAHLSISFAQKSTQTDVKLDFSLQGMGAKVRQDSCLGLEPTEKWRKKSRLNFEFSTRECLGLKILIRISFGVKIWSEKVSVSSWAEK